MTKREYSENDYTILTILSVLSNVRGLLLLIDKFGTRSNETNPHAYSKVINKEHCLAGIVI